MPCVLLTASLMLEDTAIQTGINDLVCLSYRHMCSFVTLNIVVMWCKSSGELQQCHLVPHAFSVLTCVNQLLQLPCQVEGEIPKQLLGTYFRNGPGLQVPHCAMYKLAPCHMPCMQAL